VTLATNSSSALSISPRLAHSVIDRNHPAHPPKTPHFRCRTFPPHILVLSHKHFWSLQQVRRFATPLPASRAQNTQTAGHFRRSPPPSPHALVHERRNSHPPPYNFASHISEQDISPNQLCLALLPLESSSASQPTPLNTLRLSRLRRGVTCRRLGSLSCTLST
jgi:hypothetical protein